MRKFYTNANMLIRNFFKCSVDVKCYLFKTYCSTMYCSAMWFDTTKSAMKKLKVAYNNSLRKLLSLHTYNSATEMFAVLNIPSFGELLRKFAFSFMSRMSSSINVFMVNVVAMSSSQCVNRGRACIVVNRDNYSEYYMCVHVVWQVTVLRLLIISPLNNYAHLMYLCNKCCIGTYYL